MKYLLILVVLVTGCTGLEYDDEVTNEPPVVTIVQPFDGATLSNDIEFTGSATDPEDGNISAELTWTSDIDGNLAFRQPAFTTTLSVGTHLITATASDSDGESGAATVTITVTD